MNVIKGYIHKFQNMPLQVKVSLIYTISSIIQKCIVFITLPIFTRLMTETQYGQYSYYQSWLSLIIIFSTLNLQYGSFDTAMIKFENDRSRYISSLQGLITLITTLLFFIYIINPKFWNNLLDMPTILMVAMFIEILFSTVIAFWTNRARFEYKYKEMVFLTLAISLLSPLLGLFAVTHSTEKGVARIVSNVFVYLSIGLFIYFYHLKKGKTLFDKNYWTYALKFNIPLIPYYLSQMIFNQSDRIMIKSMCNFDKVALYSMGNQLGLVLVFVLNAINSSFVPWMYNNLKKENYKPLKKVSNYLVFLISCILLSLILFGPECIYILGGTKYASAVWVVPPVAGSLLFLFLSQLSINIMFFYEDTSALVKGSILSAVINVVLNYLLIPIFGFIAAGYTTLFSYIIFWLSNLYYMNKTCSNKIKEYRMDLLFDFKILIKISSIFLIALIIFTISYSYFILRFILSCFIIIGAIKYRRKILSTFSIFKGND